MEARNRSLSDWFARIRSGQIVLPRFQRFEAWTHRHVTDLLDTVLRGLPAGALLVLEIGDSEPFISRPMQGAPDAEGRPVEHLLDGQQRLTALWRSLTGDYDDRDYFVERVTGEAARDDESLVEGDWRTTTVPRYLRNGQRYPRWADSPREIWRRKMIPVHLLRPDSSAEGAFSEWRATATDGTTEDLIELVQAASELRGRFARFNLPFLSLPIGTSPDTALDVFVQMNTSAQPLTTYDIVVAQVEAGTGFSLHELVEDLQAQAPDLERYADLSRIILTSGALLQDRSPSQSVMRGRDFCEALIDQWDDLVQGVRRTELFLEEERVFDHRRIPSDPVVALLVALWARAPEGLDGEGEARTILRRFLWRAFATDRYERSSNSRSRADYRLLRSRLGGVDDGLPPIFDEESHPLPSAQELKAAGWPGRKDRLGRAIMLVSLAHGGLDFADGGHATYDSILKREYHHLYPRAFLRAQGVNDSLSNRALNCALVTWRTNRNIAAKDPANYVRERVDQASLGEAEVRRRLESHLIPVQELMAGDYEAFLDARAEVLHPHLADRCR